MWRVLVGQQPVCRQGGGNVRPRWDFFVSYTQADREWAEWIAWVLEEDGYRVLIQAWDFVPGSNWIERMQAARAARRGSRGGLGLADRFYRPPEW
jgi:hypothetical protein